MKYIILITLSAFALGCKKEKFTAPPEFEKLIGTWESVDNDEKMQLIFRQDGKIEHTLEYQRSYKFKSTSCEYLSGSHVFSFKKYENGLQFGVFTNETFDTIGNYFSGFDPPDSSLNQFVSFIKIK